MESVSGIKEAVQPNDGAASERERSTIEFPYTDLENAIEVVKGVHNAGGTACEYEQLAAELNMESKGGSFRLRVNGAKTYGLISSERGGRITMNDLGRQIIDSQTERAARRDAFLSVELFAKVFEQFNGSPLPPQAALERVVEGMGVGPKVKDRARQVLLRSAKQAGFFDARADRLVKPSIRQELQDQSGASPQGQAIDESKKPGIQADGVGAHGGGGGGDGGSGGQRHPLIQGLLMTLPEPGSAWDPDARKNWLTMANSIFTMIYAGDAGTIRIELSGKPSKEALPSA